MREQLKKEAEKFAEMNEGRTPGEWFFSARTLRSEIKDEEGDIIETPDILGVDSDRCIYVRKGSDQDLIAFAPEMVDLITRQDAYIDGLEAKLKAAEQILIIVNEANKQERLPDLSIINHTRNKIETLHELVRVALEQVSRSGK